MITTPHPGPQTRKILQRLRAVEAAAALTHGIADEPVVLHRASGAVIEDPDGNLFLDMVAGFGSLNLGHSHPRLIAAVSDQLARGQQAMSLASTVRTDLVERLAAVANFDCRVLLTSSGTEAVETALKFARRATGRHGVVAFSGAFHGRTMGALTLMGRASERQGLGALIPGVVHLPYPDAYRPPLGTSPDDVSEKTLALLDHQLSDPASGWMEVGAVIIEPVQGNGGMIAAPGGFLTGLRELCSKHGALLIVDEVMSGFHRTGRRFAFEFEDGLSPDIIVLGKSLSAGIPLSGLLLSAEVAGAGPSGSESSTYAGNLVSCAAALVAMDIYQEEDFSSRAAALGDHALDVLNSDLGHHPNVGDIRGTGLMLAVELVEDRATRQPLPIARSLSDLATRRGLLVYPGGHYGNVIALLPPLIATERQLTTASSILRELLNAL